MEEKRYISTHLARYEAHAPKKCVQEEWIDHYMYVKDGNGQIVDLQTPGCNLVCGTKTIKWKGRAHLFAHAWGGTAYLPIVRMFVQHHFIY